MTDQIDEPSSDGDLDVGRALLRWFGSSNLPYPYVPDFAIDSLRVQRPSSLTTSEVDPLELYRFDDVADSLLGHGGDIRFAVSYDGHGLNSYAWTVLLVRPGLRLLAQVGFGGMFGDPDGQRHALSELFETIAGIDGEVPPGIRRDIVVLMSDIRDVRATAWATKQPRPLRDWIEQAGHGHPLLVVDDLIAPREWPSRTHRREFATRQELVAHQAAVTYEWAARFPEAAAGDVDDPAADLALAQAMAEWTDPNESHAWLPLTFENPACWWCYGEREDTIHQ